MPQECAIIEKQTEHRVHVKCKVSATKQLTLICTSLITGILTDLLRSSACCFAFIRIFAYVYMRACLSKNTRTCTHVYTQMCTCVYTQRHTHTKRHVQTRSHTRTHTYAPGLHPSPPQPLPPSLYTCSIPHPEETLPVPRPPPATGCPSSSGPWLLQKLDVSQLLVQEPCLCSNSFLSSSAPTLVFILWL